MWACLSNSDMLSSFLNAKISNNFALPMEETTWDNESRSCKESIEESGHIPIKIEGVWKKNHKKIQPLCSHSQVFNITNPFSSPICIVCIH
jgi:hypothetical protein